MRKIRRSDCKQSYTHIKGPEPAPEDELYMVDLAWDLVVNNKQWPANEDSVPGMGLSMTILKEAQELSSDWMGWGFYNHKTKRGSHISGIPVLLYRSQEDAALARVRWPGANWEF
jgi:hypothetical protein